MWDRGDYISEANRQLDDRQVYEEIEVDPTLDLGKTINSRLNELREDDPGLEEVTDYLQVKDSRLGRFYLLPKIHKGFSSVKGSWSTSMLCGPRLLSIHNTAVRFAAESSWHSSKLMVPPRTQPEFDTGQCHYVKHIFFKPLLI